MKPSEFEKYCFYCKDVPAEVVRNIPLMRKNGYKLIDFETHLCKECNDLDDKILSNFFQYVVVWRGLL